VRSEILSIAISVVALVISFFSVLASRRSATAAVASARAAEGRLDQQRVETREYWIKQIAEVIAKNLNASNWQMSAQAVVRVLDSLPDDLRAQSQVLVELAYKRATSEQGFAGFWQELEGIQGRGPLAGR
jgi:type II secretory pathway pseudopilin PulG